MKIAVVGGTGTLGVPLLAEPATRGAEVWALSRRVPKRLPEGVTHRQVDLTGEGDLAGALAGAEAVVDAFNAPPSAGKVPAGRLPEVAGPRVQTLTELAAAWRRAHGRRRLPLHVPMIGGLDRG